MKKTYEESISGTILEDTTVPARGSWSRTLVKGQMLRIVDLEGKQAVDFLCYNARDYSDRYAAADTMKINPSGIFLSTGTVLYSVGLTPLFTIVADTCGKHDTIGGCCSAALNKFRYGVGYQPNCRDNFLRELNKVGMGPNNLAANVNFFMYVPVGENGEMDMGPSISKPGDYVDLRADNDVLAVISNCPQINNPVNDYNPTAIRVMVWSLQIEVHPGDLNSVQNAYIACIAPSNAIGALGPKLEAIFVAHPSLLFCNRVERSNPEQDPAAYGTHTLRRTKASLIYRRTKNLRAVQLLLAHTKLESTVRYLGIEVDDALEMTERTEV